MHAVDQFIANYGYFAIFGLLTLGIVGPLIPDDSILVLTGIAVHRGQLSFWPAIAVAYAGSLCGITLSYTLGRTGAIYALERYGPVKYWVDRHLPQVQHWFERYGKWSLFFGYFIAGVRHFTALGAGMSKVRMRTLALYGYPGGFAWVVSFISIGYFLGAEWEQIQRRFDRAALIVAGAVIVILLVGWWVRKKRGTI